MNGVSRAIKSFECGNLIVSITTLESSPKIVHWSTFAFTSVNLNRNNGFIGVHRWSIHRPKLRHVNGKVIRLIRSVKVGAAHARIHLSSSSAVALPDRRERSKGNDCLSNQMKRNAPTFLSYAHSLTDIFVGVFLARKRLRDRSNNKQLAIEQRPSAAAAAVSSFADEPISRANLLNSYYTNILLPKFRVLNSLPLSPHRCSSQCVELAEEHFTPNRLVTNPFLLPFECTWSIIESKPRAYRSPCRRIFNSFDDIEDYLFKTNSKLSIKFFVDDFVTRFTPVLTEKFEKKFLRLDDLSDGRERVTVPVYNDLDDERPERFTYITEVRPYDQRIRAALNDTNMTSCCDCLDK